MKTFSAPSCATSPSSATTPSERRPSSPPSSTRPARPRGPAGSRTAPARRTSTARRSSVRSRSTWRCAHAIHRDARINFLDAPGYGIFSPEARAAVAAADAVAHRPRRRLRRRGPDRASVWKFAAEFGRPVIFVVNRMDRERASFDRAMESLHKKFGRGVVASPDPGRRGEGLPRDRRPRPDGGAPATRAASARTGRSPTDLAERARERARDARRDGRRGRRRPHGEVLRPGDPRRRQDLVPGLQQEIAERKIFPVLCASSSLGIGTLRILDACVDPLPLPRGAQGRGRRQGRQAGRRSSATKRTTPSRRSSRRSRIPFAGRISYLRVRSGHFQSDGNVLERDARARPSDSRDSSSRRARSTSTSPEAKAGDIVAVAKLKETADRRHADDQGSPGRPSEARRFRRRRSPTRSSRRRRGTRTRSRPPSTS